MLNAHEVEHLVRTCQTAAESAEAFSRGIDDFNTRVDEQPAVIRPLVMRDFEANTGMSADEWKIFLNKLSTRYTVIHDAATRLSEVLAQEGEPDTDAAIASLKEAATPLMEGAVAAIKAMATISAYLEGLPAKINMIPGTFMPTDVRDELIDSVPAYIERADALKVLLEETDVQLHAVFT